MVRCRIEAGGYLAEVSAGLRLFKFSNLAKDSSFLPPRRSVIVGFGYYGQPDPSDELLN